MFRSRTFLSFFHQGPQKQFSCLRKHSGGIRSQRKFEFLFDPWEKCWDNQFSIIKTFTRRNKTKRSNATKNNYTLYMYVPGLSKSSRAQTRSQRQSNNTGKPFFAFPGLCTPPDTFLPFFVVISILNQFYDFLFVNSESGKNLKQKNEFEWNRLLCGFSLEKCNLIVFLSAGLSGWWQFGELPVVLFAY